MYKRLIFLGIMLSLVSLVDVRGEIANHVVISEVQTSGGTSNDEFIELYNPTSNVIDISGWSLQVKSATGNYQTVSKKNFVAGNAIPSYGFFLVAHTDYDGDITPDMSHSTFTMASTGGNIFLVNDQNDVDSANDINIVDRVAYGTGDSPEGTAIGAPSTDQSIERRSALVHSDSEGNGWDTNDNSADFFIATTPAQQNSTNASEFDITQPVISDVVVNETVINRTANYRVDCFVFDNMILNNSLMVEIYFNNTKNNGAWQNISNVKFDTSTQSWFSNNETNTADDFLDNLDFNCIVSDRLNIQERLVNDVLTVLNNDPVASLVLNFSKSEDFGSFTIDLTDNESDVEDAGIDLNWNITGLNDSLVLISIDTITDVLTFTSIANETGSVILNFTLNDSDKGIDSFITVLTISEINDVPTFDPISDFSLDEDFGTYTIDVSTNISDVETLDVDLTIDFVNSNSSLLSLDVNNSTNVVTFTSIGNQSGTASINLTVLDSGGLQDSSAFTITVNAVNDLPLRKDTIPDIIFDEDGSNSSIDLDNFFVDIDTSLAFIVLLVTDTNVSVKIDSLNNIVNISAADNFFGTANIVFGAYDVIENMVLQNTILVTVNPINDVPIWNEFNIIAVEDSGLNNTINLSEFIIDADNASGDFTLTILKENESEIDLSIAANGENLEFKPANNFSGVSIGVVEVSDGTDTSNLTILFNITGVNDPPLFTSTPLLTVNEDRPYSYQVTAEDVDNDVLSYSISGNGWLGIDSISGLVAGFPTNDDVGTHSIVITVSDGVSSRSQSLSITVNNVNDAPVLDPLGQQDLRVDVPFILTVSASDDDVADVLTFSINDTSLFNIGSSSGVISFTPGLSQEGLHWINISVRDTKGEVDSEAVLFNITHLNNKPVNLTIPDLSWDEDTNQSLNLSDFFIDADGDTLTFSSTIPRNITVLIDQGVVTLVPDKDFFGINLINFSANDGVNETDSNEATLTVNPVNDKPRIVSSEPSIFNPKIHRNREQTFNIIKSDVDNEVLNVEWYVDRSIVGGEVADEFTFDPSSAGTFNVTVIVRDVEDSIAKEWSLLVAERPLASNFGGSTTSFATLSEDELQNVSNVVLEDISKGSIAFIQNLNLSEVVDMDNNVKIENGIIAINSANLPELNKPARITLKGLSYNTNPKIFVNSGFTTNSNEITQECSGCTLISFTEPPTSNGDVVFDVTGFSSYRVGESGEVSPIVFENLDSCDAGVTGDLNVDIKEPGKNDDFNPGEIIDIEVEVENNGEEDLDIEVIAILYNKDNEDEEEKERSDEQEVNEGDEEMFEIQLNTGNDLDEKDDYILFVKAFESGNEDEHCAEDFIEIDIEREDHDIRVGDVFLSPLVVSCENVVGVRVDVENFGSKDEEDVYVEVKNLELGLDMKSEEFDLDSEDRVSKRLSFKIPEDIEEGNYIIDTSVVFDDGDWSDSKSATLRVSKCEEVLIKPLGIKIVSKDIRAEDGVANIHLVLDNKEMRDLGALLEIRAVGNWASTSPQHLDLHPGENNVYVDLGLREDVEGLRSASVVVRPREEADFEVLEDSFNVEVIKVSRLEEEKEPLFYVWGIGILLLLILIMLFLMIMIRKR